MDDCCTAAAYNLKEALEVVSTPYVKPVTYNERTGHCIKEGENKLQVLIDEFSDFTSENKFLINDQKCQAMIFNFSRLYAFPSDLKIHGSDLLTEVTQSKILGLIIQSNLKWDMNTEFICKKTSTKLWLLRRLKRLDIDTELLLDFYKKEIRCHLEYAVPVWYSGITLEQSKAIEAIQRYSVSIILNNWSLPYKIKCTLLSLEPLYLRRPQLALSFSLKTIKSGQHEELFKPKKKTYNTRNKGDVYFEEKANTDIFFKSPLLSLNRDLNQHLKSKMRGI